MRVEVETAALQANDGESGVDVNTRCEDPTLSFSSETHPSCLAKLSEVVGLDRPFNRRHCVKTWPMGSLTR